MSSARGMAFEYLEQSRIFVSYQGEHAATAAEWDSYIARVLELTDTVQIRFVVWAGAHPPPSSEQRRIGDAVRGRNHLVALISDSLALRFVVSAFSLVNRHIRYFTPTQWYEALDHVQCNAQEKLVVSACKERLKSAVGS